MFLDTVTCLSQTIKLGFWNGKTKNLSFFYTNTHNLFHDKQGTCHKRIFVVCIWLKSPFICLGKCLTKMKHSVWSCWHTLYHRWENWKFPFTTINLLVNYMMTKLNKIFVLMNLPSFTWKNEEMILICHPKKNKTFFFISKKFWLSKDEQRRQRKA